jgi:uncharacterized protein YaiI (UPF0178 family)
MVHIFVDNDACPVKEEILKVATRYAVGVTLVSNQGMRPIRLPNVKQVVVGAGFDAADDWIAQHAASGDIVITADILLAGRCLSTGCKVVGPNGHIFTQQNIGGAIAMRELSAHLRETGESKGYNRSFSQKDRSQFLQSLDKLISKANHP